MVTLFETPAGQSEGRESKSFPLHQVTGILAAAEGKFYMDAYIHLSVRPRHVRLARASVRRHRRLQAQAQADGEAGELREDTGRFFTDRLVAAR